MKLSTLVMAVVLVSAITLEAQDTAPQNTPTGAQTEKSMEPSAMPDHQGMGGMHGMSAMHQQHQKEMQANLDKMHALLNDMRTKAASLNQKDRAPMMDNVQMWQMMLDHLDSMMKHMQEMQSGVGPMDKSHSKHHGGMMHPQGGTGQDQSSAPPSGGETAPEPSQPPQAPPQTK
jgi:hypothetical protein